MRTASAYPPHCLRCMMGGLILIKYSSTDGQDRPMSRAISKSNPDQLLTNPGAPWVFCCLIASILSKNTFRQLAPSSPLSSIVSETPPWPMGAPCGSKTPPWPMGATCGKLSKSTLPKASDPNKQFPSAGNKISCIPDPEISCHGVHAMESSGPAEQCNFLSSCTALFAASQSPSVAAAKANGQLLAAWCPYV